MIKTDWIAKNDKLDYLSFVLFAFKLSWLLHRIQTLRNTESYSCGYKHLRAAVTNLAVTTSIRRVHHCNFLFLPSAFELLSRLTAEIFCENSIWLSMHEFAELRRSCC